MSQQELAAGTEGRYAIEEFTRQVGSRTETRYRVVDTETDQVEGVRWSLDQARHYARRVARGATGPPMTPITLRHLTEERGKRPGKLVERVR